MRKIPAAGDDPNSTKPTDGASKTYKSKVRTTECGLHSRQRHTDNDSVDGGRRRVRADELEARERVSGGSLKKKMRFFVFPFFFLKLAHL